MIAPTNIQPPKNWQDFEMLCLKLWGEIWDIQHEIEFNSDNAQGQQGVDIYGPIDGGLKYYGVQCKNKKLNLINGEPNRITIADIQAEIDKALTFEPALGKLVIATSLQKDQKVEAFVRNKSQEQVSKGLFSVQICFWDFFERKLPEFPKVEDWYLKNENFHRKRSVGVSFAEGLKELTFEPKYQKNVDKYIYRSAQEQQEIVQAKAALNGELGFDKMFAALRAAPMLTTQYRDISPKTPWHQKCWLRIVITNTGSAVIENFKVKLEFDGYFSGVGGEYRSPVTSPNFKSNIIEYRNSDTELMIKPAEAELVQGETFSSHSIYIVPVIDMEAKVKLRWKLLARDFEDSGELDIVIQPKYFRKVTVHEVESPEEVKEEVAYDLIQRPCNISPFHGTTFLDDESDYTFE